MRGPLAESQVLEVEANKTELLQLRMREFRALVEAERINDSSLDSVLDQLGPLFSDIEAGRVIPPATRCTMCTAAHRGTQHAHKHRN